MNLRSGSHPPVYSDDSPALVLSSTQPHNLLSLQTPLVGPLRHSELSISLLLLVIGSEVCPLVLNFWSFRTPNRKLNVSQSGQLSANCIRAISSKNNPIREMFIVSLSDLNRFLPYPSFTTSNTFGISFDPLGAPICV